MTPANKRRRGIPADQFTTLEAAEISGLTLRQLQYWDESGFLVPAFGHIKHSRRYSAEQVLFLKRFYKLRQAGIPFHKIKTLVDLPWETVIGSDRPVLVGTTLVIPRDIYDTTGRRRYSVLKVGEKMGSAEPGRRSGRRSTKQKSYRRDQCEDAILDAIALQDPLIAEGRKKEQLWS